jgi:hypothetical protein
MNSCLCPKSEFEKEEEVQTKFIFTFIAVIGALCGLNLNPKNLREETGYEKTLYLPFIDGTIFTPDPCALV